MLSDPVWIHRVSSEQLFNDLALDFRLKPADLYQDNLHLMNRHKVEPGDVVFLPLAGRNKSDLRRRYADWPEALFQRVEGISEWEATYVQTGGSSATSQKR